MDVTAAIAAIADASPDIVLIATAVFGVLVTIKLGKWVRRAL